MKYFVMIVILLSIVLSAHAELTSDDVKKIQEIVNNNSQLGEADLNKIRLLIHAELKPIKTEIQSVKDDLQSVKESVAKLDGRIDGIEKFITWLLATIILVFGVPQVIALWLDRKDSKLEKQQIETLTREVEALKNQRIQAP